MQHQRTNRNDKSCLKFKLILSHNCNKQYADIFIFIIWYNDFSYNLVFVDIKPQDYPE